MVLDHRVSSGFVALEIRLYPYVQPVRVVQSETGVSVYLISAVDPVKHCTLHQSLVVEAVVVGLVGVESSSQFVHHLVVDLSQSLES